MPHTTRPRASQDAGEVVVLLADERRHRRALDDRFHVRLGRAQRAADDLARHRVGARRAPAPGPARPLHRRAPSRADHEIAGAIDRGALPGRDHGGGVELLDDGRARHRRAGAELLARRGMGTSSSRRRAKKTRRRAGRARAGAAPLEGRDAEAPDAPGGGHAQRDDLDRRLGQRIRVELAVALVEPREQRDRSRDRAPATGRSARSPGGGSAGRPGA